MLTFDASQEQVLALDPLQHARVLGAPGSGKTALVVEAYARFRDIPGWGEQDVLILAANRAVASRLRQRVEGRVARAMGGTPVRTPASYAFSIVQRYAALHGVVASRLLTGTVHDTIIQQVLSERLSRNEFVELRERFSAEVILGDVFRSEIRDLSRILDDFAMTSAELASLLQPAAGAPADANAPSADQQMLWAAAAEITSVVQHQMRVERPEELTSSELLSHAASVISADEALAVPKLVLIDDAQELGEGALSLLAALANRGTRIWVFGDPDLATSAFHGERTTVLSGLSFELRRRGVLTEAAEAAVTLSHVHRHNSELRTFIRQLSGRVGTAGVGGQRTAESFSGHPLSATPTLEFAAVSSTAEQLGAVAHRLRRRHLGIDTGVTQPWNSMAVICRTRAEVARAARTLAGHQVPTNVATGGLVLREHQLVRELIILTQYACGLRELQSRDIWELLSGSVGGVDPIAIRRFRAELRLREQRTARAEDREVRTVDALMSAAFFAPGDAPVIDARSGRQLLRIGRLVERARAIHERGGTAREVLWEIWEGTKLADALQATALEQRGTAADHAHLTLDAVMGLFFALQRHEEQDSTQPIAELLSGLLTNAVAEDSLAARSERDVVTITTPQGAVGMEFDLVCVLGPQDGTWPNLRARGSLLGLTALERWLRGNEPSQPSRRDTLHDELRLFLHSCARTTNELLVVAVTDEDHHPSPFFGFGSAYLRDAPLPSSRLTLRGVVAEMRRRVTITPSDVVAVHSLVALAQDKAAGAHPDEWYGVQPLSNAAPLTDLENDERALVSVSPSRMEASERCPLDWVISQLGGAPAGAAQQLGTLLHFAFERGEELRTPEQIFEAVAAQWSQLNFEAEWQSQRSLAVAREISVGIAEYLADFAQSARTLVGTEVPLKLPLGRALLKGSADRLEALERADGTVELSVVDLKTGSKFPSANEIVSHAQLQAYQLGIIEGGYHLPGESEAIAGSNGGARLLYVDPGVRTTRGADAGSSFRVAAQPQLSSDVQEAFVARVAAAAEVMAAGTFTARVEHHCSDPHALGGSCALHIIPGVSHA